MAARPVAMPSRAAVAASRRKARPGAGRPRERGDAASVVPPDAHRGGRRRGVPVADAPLGSPRSRRPTRSRRPAPRSTRPIRVTFTYQGEELRRSCWSRSTATTRELALVEPGRKQSTFIDPAIPTRRRSSGRARGGRSSTSGSFAPHWENFAKVWNLHRLPAAAVQHDRRSPSSGRSGRSCRARSWRTASPGSGSRAAILCSRCSSPRSSCPTAVTIIPTYTIFVEARLGRDLAAAARADVLRQRLRRLPDAPVLPDDPDARWTRRRPSTAPARSAPCGRSSCRSHGRSSSPSRSSTSSTRGTTSSGR